MTAPAERPFGDLVRRLRQVAGHTQDSLAEQVGCATQTIRKIEAGERRPSHQMAARIAQVLGVPADERPAFLEAARASGDRGAGDDAGAPQAAPARGLPAYLTAFIGREHERANLLRLLESPSCRLITLLGPGGIGKTRLAVELAARYDGLADGVCFVGLVSVGEPRVIAEAIAAAMGLAAPGAADLTSRLLRELHDKALLLVLDNIEHLLDPEGATVGLLRQILRGAPQVKLLVTSRERLRLQGEWVIEVAGLPTAGDQRAESLLGSPAVQLFLAHAQRAQRGFRLAPGDLAAIAAICGLVEGMPLGIELAAAWLPVLSAQEIARELARGLDDQLLSANDRPARHASLQAVFEQSWRLLSEDEQGTLRRLAVFRGGCTREAAAEVAGATIMMLAALVDKSLLRRSGAGRYELHEVIRQHALAKLHADPQGQRATHAGHSAYYAALLRRSTLGPQAGGSSPQAWASLMDDIDNVRAAWARAAREGDGETVLAMARGMMLLYDTPGWVPEGAALFQRAAGALRAAGGRADAALAVALGYQGYFLQLRQPAAGAPLLEEAVALLGLAGDGARQAQFLLHLGTIQIAAGRFEEARARYELAHRRASDGDDPLTQTWAAFYQGVLAIFAGDRAAAERVLTDFLQLWRGQQFRRGLTMCLNSLSEVARQGGRYGEAAALAREGLEISSTSRYRPGVARSLRELGALALEQGDLAGAEYLLGESCATFEGIGRPWVYGRSRALLARLEVLQGRHDAARRGCAEMLQLARDGAAIMLPEAAYVMALLLASGGEPAEALALLCASEGAPGEAATLAAAARLRDELAGGLPAARREAAEAQAREGGLVPRLEGLAREA